MMEKFDNIGKQMPYKESQEYLDNLVSRVTEKAVEEGRESLQKGRKRGLHTILWPAVSIAAAVLLFVFLGRGAGEPENQTSIAMNTESPIDTFLNGLSDEELMQLSSYEIEEVSLAEEDKSYE
ncbi:MAG: hypothetical protein IJ855_01990 [Bacteroidales bacterium]|nr:hypothetical protein [Bacteroidales bacterium]